MSAPRLVVTGATGFVGRRLVRSALARGWRVCALARDPARVEPRGHPALTAHPFDLRDPSAAAEVLARADLVCHLAAFIPADYSDPAFAPECMEVNALGTLRLLETVARAGGGYFVHVSSGNAYAPLGRPAREDDPLFPAASAPYYFASKIAGDLFAEHFRLRRGVAGATLRITSVYGPGMPPGSVVARFLAAARAGRPLELRDGGRHRSDLLWVDDVAEACFLAFAARESGIFNLGSGATLTVREMAETIVAETGADPGLLRVEPPTGSAPSTGFDGVDISRARARLGFVPTPFAEGIGRCRRGDPSDPIPTLPAPEHE